MFTQEVTTEPLLPTNGYLPVRRVVPAPELLQEARADADRTKVWEERLSRVRSAG
jgi:O-succinylbenzoate synthase